MSASKSALSFLYKSVAVEIAPHLESSLKAEHVQRFPPFVRWFNRLQASLHSTPVKGGGAGPTEASYYKLKKIDIQSADFFGKAQTKLGFLKLKATVEDDFGRTLPGIVLLRGQSVAILLLLYPSETPDEPAEADWDESKAHVVLTVQPRVAGATMSSVELPAGMFDPGDADDGGSLSFTAQRELKEECGIEIAPKDMKPLFTADGGLYMSAGLCDEQLQFFYCRKLMHQAEIEKLEGRFGGAPDEAERITLRIMPYKDLIASTRDSKALCAIALYDHLVT